MTINFLCTQIEALTTSQAMRKRPEMYWGKEWEADWFPNTLLAEAVRDVIHFIDGPTDKVRVNISYSQCDTIGIHIFGGSWNMRESYGKPLYYAPDRLLSGLTQSANLGILGLNVLSKELSFDMISNDVAIHAKFEKGELSSESWIESKNNSDLVQTIAISCKLDYSFLKFSKLYKPDTIRLIRELRLPENALVWEKQ